jgi:rfaE bifunctional protein kinase chain/domain
MKYSSIEDLFDQFGQKKVLILGDVMIDSYLWGGVDRISPEAPVPIVSVGSREKRLGGAANVALNIQSLGAEPILVAVVGEDQDGKDFFNILDEQKLDAEGIVVDKSRVTTIKHRIIAGDQHLLRVDQEDDTPVNAEIEEEIIARAKALMPQVQVIVFEDYDKGALTPRIITAVIEEAEKLGIPTIVDPKKRNFLAYNKATIFKPNLKELKEGLKIDIDKNIMADVEKGAVKLCSKMNLKGALITLSEYGMYLNFDGKGNHVPAHVRKIMDVSGAGDTVVSVGALCLASDTSANFLVNLSNLAGGLVCEHVGVVPINKDRLLAEALDKELVNLL